MERSRPVSGAEYNTWGSIWKAFEQIAPGIEPAIYYLRFVAYFFDPVVNNAVELSRQSNPDHGSVHSFEFNHSAVSAASAFEQLLGAPSAAGTPGVDNLNADAFIKLLHEGSSDSPYIFRCWPVSNSEQKLVMRFRRDVWARNASIADQPYVDRTPKEFLEAVTSFCVMEYGRELGLDGEPRTRSRLSHTEILWRAGANLVRNCAVGPGSKALVNEDLFEEIDVISTIAYEKRPCGGSLVLVDPEDCELILKFDEPLPLSSHRVVRKLLEASSETAPLATDGAQVFGLITPLNREAPSRLRIRFKHHHCWSVDVGYERQLFVVVDGCPTIERSRLERSLVTATLQERYENDAVDVEAVWSIMEAAVDSPAGALIVVSDRAPAEADRFAGECIRTDPVHVAPGALATIFRIDGAMLLDTKGRCHAVGVILDGPATNRGDRARGSRYNAAVRYIDNSGEHEIAVVVSEDGTVDMVV